MKKTSIFNLGGNACYIDEDAAEVLKNYLDSLRKHFGESASTNEVMNDIEMRLWEIFNEHKRYGMQVVSMQEVDEAIAVLGKVEDFGSIDDKESDTKEAATNNSRDNVNNNGASAPLYPEEDFIKKKLFRNPDDKIIGGVASGLGTYLDISPMWMRIIFLIFFLFTGYGIIVYLVMWLIIPMARTAAQRLEMRGIRPTAENIRQFVSTNIETGNIVVRNTGNGCLQAAAIGCAGILVLPIIALALFILVIVGGSLIAIPSSIVTDSVRFHFGDTTLPIALFNDWFSILLLNALWIVPLVLIIVLLINRWWPQSRSIIRNIEISALIVWLLALTTLAVKVILQIH